MVTHVWYTPYPRIGISKPEGILCFVVMSISAVATEAKARTFRMGFTRIDIVLKLKVARDLMLEIRSLSVKKTSQTEVQDLDIPSFTRNQASPKMGRYR